MGNRYAKKLSQFLWRVIEIMECWSRVNPWLDEVSWITPILFQWKSCPSHVLFALGGNFPLILIAAFFFMLIGTVGKCFRMEKSDRVKLPSVHIAGPVYRYFKKNRKMMLWCFHVFIVSNLTLSDSHLCFSFWPLCLHCPFPSSL